MSSAKPPDRSRRDPATQTLGDLLYADHGKARVPEARWVGLVRSIAAGDQQALYALYEQAHRLVFTLIVRITNNGETAEEVTLDVFHDVWRRAAAYDPAAGSVLGWIMNQAHSRAIDRLRFEQRRKRVGTHVDDPPDASAANDPEAIVNVREQGHRLRQAVGLLAPGERRAIEAAFFAGLTYREVAVKLGEPLGTVKTRVRAGLGKLRRALGGERRG